MEIKDFIQSEYGISPETFALCSQAEEEVRPQFAEIDKTAELNQIKVLKAFSEHKVSEAHLGYSTGYGYDDLGRDTLEKIYADVFGTESALVRSSIVSGTHAICSCLFGVLRPGDTLLSATGAPYDTLEEIIGKRGSGDGSLKEWGIGYREVPLLKDGKINLTALGEALADKSVRLVELQRSKGYAWRPSYTLSDMEDAIALIKQKRPDVFVMVDNCYGEFVESLEPPQIGADLIAGSLIKNPGGGLALTGGYLAGKRGLVEQISYRLTSPGIGAEVGASLGMNRHMYQGFFMAPHTVAQALKIAVLTAKVFEKLGYDVSPKAEDKRGDIIQSVKFGSSEKLCAYCRGIQRGAPIDSFVVPEPWDMPGYENQVIMAAGAFVSGASIEISADGPIRPPYAAYMQGGLTYESGKLSVLCAADNLRKL